MSHENANVETLKEAYRLWHDTKAGSVDHTNLLRTFTASLGTLRIDAVMFTETARDVFG